MWIIYRISEYLGHPFLNKEENKEEKDEDKTKLGSSGFQLCLAFGYNFHSVEQVKCSLLQLQSVLNEDENKALYFVRGVEGAREVLENDVNASNARIQEIQKQTLDADTAIAAKNTLLAQRNENYIQMLDNVEIQMNQAIERLNIH
ncbi:hypothetical protein L1987_64029 [Smallanthus sonchifolius]|uniref:Uncharacterized protein n=1 Tax=Smallanthus sonchifolius TaxID=185202 RepID=A0ACB9CEY2_9ASTR|nr:hypothetical protein L1987_64029 [Smallanthus sonchifolius]